MGKKDKDKDKKKEKTPENGRPSPMAFPADYLALEAGFLQAAQAATALCRASKIPLSDLRYGEKVVEALVGVYENTRLYPLTFVRAAHETSPLWVIMDKAQTNDVFIKQVEWAQDAVQAAGKAYLGGLRARLIGARLSLLGAVKLAGWSPLAIGAAENGGAFYDNDLTFVCRHVRRCGLIALSKQQHG